MALCNCPSSVSWPPLMMRLPRQRWSCISQYEFLIGKTMSYSLFDGGGQHGAALCAGLGIPAMMSKTWLRQAGVIWRTWHG